MAEPARKRNGYERSPSESLRISLFGKFEVRRNAESLRGLGSGKTQELFCYLLLFRGRQHSRDALATLLWGDHPTEKARKYLRQALWHLHMALGQATGPLRIEQEWITCNLVDWLDVEVFEQAYESAQILSSGVMDVPTARRLEEATQLYRSGLLPGLYHDWCLEERDRLQSMYLRMLMKLMDFSELRGDYGSSIMYAERVLKEDSAHERTHQRLMYLLYVTGDRTAALRQFHRCAAALREELGVNVARKTRELFERIRSDDLALPPPPQAASNGKLNSLRDMHAGLGQMKSMLSRLQEEIETVMDTQRIH